MNAPLPDSVVERCAATTGTYGRCHGATASGANTLAADNPADSLRELARDMDMAYARWLAREEAR